MAKCQFLGPQLASYCLNKKVVSYTNRARVVSIGGACWHSRAIVFGYTGHNNDTRQERQY